MTDNVYTLSNGYAIPTVGFGTWQLPADIGAETVKNAIEVGYRHIDTAAAYGNEKEVGEGVRLSGVPREQLYITTKIPAEVKSYEGAKRSIEDSLARLNSGYIDLMLIHAPRPWDEMHRGEKTPYSEENRAVWRAMEEAVESGKIRSIGLSNFQKEDIENILSTAKIKPVVNQIKVHIGNHPKRLADYCKKQGILIEAYSPVATGRLKKDENILKAAEKYGVSVPRLCIRYVLEKGYLPLPKTTHKEYMEDNLKLDFVIDRADVALFDGLKTASDKLTDQKGVGKAYEKLLNEVGIHKFPQLSETGAVAAFEAIKKNHPNVSERLLKVLEEITK